MSNHLTDSNYQNIEYRRDIDGLRAIAVLSVITYHFFPSWLTGGYTGVDVFFVISGYLISNHILTSLITNRDFSLIGFYKRRVRRILPAMLVMVLITVIAGYFIFSDFYFRALGEQAFSANLSYSNIYFYLHSGYFDIDSSLMPLLHTWSLGVEEQFYLVWPLVLMLATFLLNRRGYIIGLMLALMAISFLLNDLFRADRNAIFYLMPFRVFEFAFGAIAAIVMLNKERDYGVSETRNWLALVCLSLLILPFFYLDDASVFPYYNAIPTVVGTAGLLCLPNTRVSGILSLKPLVYIGLISYSLYLYHWPVLVLSKAYFIDLDNTLLLVIVIVMTLTTALLSYHYVEKPFRYSGSIGVKFMFAVLVVVVFLLSSLVKSGLLNSVHHNDKLVHRSIAEDRLIQYSVLDESGCRIDMILPSSHCNWQAEKQILFFGNSHNINSFNIFFDQLGNRDDYNLIFPGDAETCISNQIEKIKIDFYCRYGDSNLTLDQYVTQLHTVVVNFFDISTLGAKYMNVVEQMRSLNPDLNVVVIGGYFGIRPHHCRELVNLYNDFDICKKENFVSFWGGDDLDFVLSQSFSKAHFLYIDIIELLCGKDHQLSQCKTHVDGELLFYDGDHFSLAASRYLSDLVFNHYREPLSELDIVLQE